MSQSEKHSDPRVLSVTTIGWSPGELMSEDLGGCETCKYFRFSKRSHIGECRINPPVIIQRQLAKIDQYKINLIEDVERVTVWPVTDTLDWCGQRHPVSKSEFESRFGDDERKSLFR